MANADGPDPGRVVVLSQGFWSERYASDPGVLSQTIRLDGEAYRVVGVAASDQAWPGTEIFTPLGPDPTGARDNHLMHAQPDPFRVKDPPIRSARIARGRSSVSQTHAGCVGRGLLTRAEADDILRWRGTGGFSLDGSVRVADHDRAGLERLVRYCARPPFAPGSSGWSGIVPAPRSRCTGCSTPRRTVP